MTTVNLRDTTTKTRSTRLKGVWVWAARTAWIVIVVLCLALFFRVAPIYYSILTRVTGDVGEFSIGRLSLDLFRLLGSIGLTPRHYASLVVGIYSIIVLLSTGAGLLIFIGRSDDWMALLSSGFLIMSGVMLSIIMNGRNFAIPFSWAYITIFMFSAALVSYTYFGLLFPDGRFVPRWMIPLALLNTLIPLTLSFQAVTSSVTITLGRGFNLAYFFTVRNQQVIPGWILALYFIQLFGSGIVAQVYRYFRHATPEQRQQAKWLVVGTFVVFVTFSIFVAPAMLTGNLSLNLYKNIGDLVFLISLTAIPISLGLSVLRYRIWDVDYVINRSLVYGGLTLLLTGIFIGGFFGLRALFVATLGSEQDVIAAVVPAIAVTALFNPARRRLRAFVDRRFYGILIDYATPAGDFKESARRVTSIGPYSGLVSIGSGGMGEVYRATHPELSRSVAVKILPKRLASESEFRHRFEREAQVVTGLKHPNIVQMFDYGQEGETIYMVMEFIEGIDLARMLREQGRLSLEKAAEVLSEIAAALDYAHEQGIVHRDIKPSNVMMEPLRGAGTAYRAVLMDFGIAKIAAGATRLTLSGMVGTLDYVSPEQIQGSAQVDRRADVYSLGVMAYQMLTGELPFKKNNPGALVLAHLVEPPPDAHRLAPDLPRSVCSALQQAMAKKPEERFKSAGHFVAELT